MSVVFQSLFRTKNIKLGIVRYSLRNLFLIPTILFSRRGGTFRTRRHISITLEFLNLSLLLMIYTESEESHDKKREQNDTRK